MNLLLLTASLHYLAIIPIIAKYKLNVPLFNRIYLYTIWLTTTISMIWHYTNNLLDVDYLFTALWFGEDVLWSLLLNQPHIIYLNIGIFTLNIIVDRMNNYIFYHSIWHVISAMKSIYISYLVHKIET
jgi:hypothetical protein